VIHSAKSDSSDNQHRSFQFLDQIQHIQLWSYRDMHAAHTFNKQQIILRLQLAIGSHDGRDLNGSPFSPRCIQRCDRKAEGIGTDKIG
jgi:hypothetical protein